MTSFFKFPNHLLEKETSWLSSDVTKTHTPKSQGLLRFYLHLAKDLLKINFCASFKREIVFHFENITPHDINMATVKVVTYTKK